MVRLATTLMMLVTAGLVGGYTFYAAFLSDLPDTSRLTAYRAPPENHVLAADDRELADFSGMHQHFVPVQEVPRRVIQAFLAAEDKNFYTHSGIDALRTPPEITASLSLPGFQRIIPLWVELVARYREGLHFFIRNFNSLWVEVVV